MRDTKLIKGDFLAKAFSLAICILACNGKVFGAATGEVGELLGAIGISGDTGDVDEQCAIAGIAALQFSEDK